MLFSRAVIIFQNKILAARAWGLWGDDVMPAIVGEQEAAEQSRLNCNRSLIHVAFMLSLSEIYVVRSSC